MQKLMTPSPGTARPVSDTRLGLRLVLLMMLAAIELPFLAFLYDPVSINSNSQLWLQARSILREAVPLTIFFLAACAIFAAPRRKEFTREWSNALHSHHWQSKIWLNLILFGALIFLTFTFNNYGAKQAEPPWGLFILWTMAIGLAYGLLFVAAAPFTFWRGIVNRERSLIALAAGAAITVETAALLSRQSWNVLSEATFHVSAFILRLYESDVMTDAGARNIGIGDFKVNIAAACSGFEGIGLVLTFLSIYLWIYRSELRFPNALITLPIGVAAIWLLNSVRIAILVSLGAHVSPEIAIAGFHSQAGWMMFLIVTIGMMLAIHRISVFHKPATEPTGAPSSPAAFEATALLAPFLAMTAASIFAAAFTASGYWLYGLRVIALSLALFAFWRFYRALDWKIAWEPIALGLLVGVGWVATDPATGESALGSWLATLGPLSAAAWITMRVIGTVLLVPIAEELAFRGYLHRKLIANKFETVAQGAFSWKAFIISTILFGALHERWLAGAVAGAIFALALYRSGRITGAITAHISANAVIAFWAIVFGQWSLF